MSRPRKAGSRPLPQPRNTRAVRIARDRGEPLVISLVGETPYSNPHIFVDGGQRYDWSCLGGNLDTIVVTKTGINSLDAMRAAFAACNQMRAYPTLVDLEAQEVACIIEGLRLWQVRRGTDLWQQHFAP